MHRMNKIEYIAPCHFGLEAVLKREIRDLGLEVTSVDDGRVTFAGDETIFLLAGKALTLRNTEFILVTHQTYPAPVCLLPNVAVIQ